MSKETTNQVTPPEKRNPTGKGGFAEHPENRSDGRWSKDNSFSYWMNYFKTLTPKEFEVWQKENPSDKRTIAADLAARRIIKAQNDLKEFQEIANRTEGKPEQPVKVLGDKEMPLVVLNIKNPKEKDGSDRKGSDVPTGVQRTI
jgi:hypothetical protein